MKAQHLRLGNLILRKKENGLFMETEVNLEYLQLVYAFPNDYAGARISEPVLEIMFGFKKTADGVIFGNNDKFLLFGNKDKWSIMINHDDIELGGKSHLCDIEFVHELQNIYFFLTGNELKKSSDIGQALQHYINIAK